MYSTHVSHATQAPRKSSTVLPVIAAKSFAGYAHGSAGAGSRQKSHIARTSVMFNLSSFCAPRARGWCGQSLAEQTTNAFRICGSRVFRRRVMRGPRLLYEEVSQVLDVLSGQIERRHTTDD